MMNFFYHYSSFHHVFPRRVKTEEPASRITTLTIVVVKRVSWETIVKEVIQKYVSYPC